jgi:acetyl-CoA carboxylase carboxyltransferase component
MTWLEELEEIRRRTEIAKQMGGAENIKRQHDGGKLTVRERIDRLLDNDSFHEYGALAGSTKYDEQGRLIEFRPSNLVLGSGRINGRRVVVAGDDFTVRGRRRHSQQDGLGRDVCRRAADAVGTPG